MCSVFGYISSGANTAELTLSGGYTLGHRGQEGAGLATWNQNSGEIVGQNRLGTISHLREKLDLEDFPGPVSLTHNRYGTAGGRSLSNLQPFVRGNQSKQMGIAHNGDLVWVEIDGQWLSVQAARNKLEKDGVIFNATSDTELFFPLIARSKKETKIEKIVDACNHVRGAFCLGIVWQGHLIAARDPWGFHPLWLGRYQDGYCIASEDCAFGHLGVEPLAEIEPGTVVVIKPDLTIESYDLALKGKVPLAFCSFEYVYYCRPDSIIFGQAVDTVRKLFGGTTIEEMAALDILPWDALAVPILDSGRGAALAGANRLLALQIERWEKAGKDPREILRWIKENGLPFDFGMNRNHLSGRNFITPGQTTRNAETDLKHNVTKSIVAGRAVLEIDDSSVRGTTVQRHVARFKKCGATSVHVAFASPRVTGACHYGIDTKKPGELIAQTHSLEQMKAKIGADTLYHLSLEGFKRCLGCANNFCTACFSGEYPIEIPED